MADLTPFPWRDPMGSQSSPFPCTPLVETFRIPRAERCGANIWLAVTITNGEGSTQAGTGVTTGIAPPPSLVLSTLSFLAHTNVSRHDAVCFSIITQTRIEPKLITLLSVCRHYAAGPATYTCVQPPAVADGPARCVNSLASCSTQRWTRSA